MSSATVGEPTTAAVTRIDHASAWLGTRTPRLDPTPWLTLLRAEFPDWAFLYDPWASAWVGVRGKARIEVAASAIALRDAIRAGRR